VPKESEAHRCRREAERCRELAALSDEATAKILIGLAQEYEIEALELERAEKPVGLHPSGRTRR